MTEYIQLGSKVYAYNYGKGKIKKKAKGTKKCVINKNLTMEWYKEALFKNETVIELQLQFKSDYHDVYIEKVNQVALCNVDAKRLQTFDRIITYPYGTNVFKIGETEMLVKKHKIPIPLYY